LMMMMILLIHLTNSAASFLVHSARGASASATGASLPSLDEKTSS